MRSRPGSRLSLFLALGVMAVLGVVMLAISGYTQQAQQPTAKPPDPHLQKAWRFQRGGWTYVHLEGSPAEIGYQHGYLLAPEIEDAFRAVKLQDTHNTNRDWQFFRSTAQQVLWPHIDAEYQQELHGIAEGLKARGVTMDIWDVVALNAFEELPDYYVPWLDEKEKRAGRPSAPQHAQNRDALGTAPSLHAPGNCSAFVATGSWTKDHRPVIAHNNWTSVIPGARWRMIFDIVPAKGYRMIMDGFPGVIVSDDDFTINAAGLAVTETTISRFRGFDPNGKAEFARARKATQYAKSIDEYVKIMNDGNNGGYANDWLLADFNTGEVARFEQGLKHTRLWRTRDGYFVGSNFPSDPEVMKDETDFDPNDLSSSMNARKLRWEQLMQQYKGKIDVERAKQFESDHYDSFQKKEEANERTLCGHVETSPRGVKAWDWAPYHPGGTVQAKAADAAMAKKMMFTARAGHACGADLRAAEFLAQHPEYAWQKPVLTDMIAGPWTTFRSGEKR